MFFYSSSYSGYAETEFVYEKAGQSRNSARNQFYFSGFQDKLLYSQSKVLRVSFTLAINQWP